MRALENNPELSQDEIKQQTGALVAVRDVSFEVGSESILVIMGLSGSGKSTLLRCMNRLIDPTSGSVWLETQSGRVNITEVPIKQLRMLRRKYISMVFQEFALFPHLTALKNVMCGLSIQRLPRVERLRRAMDTLALVGLQDWANAMPSQLSGGMKQRVGLARALATNTSILLMDEPFSALDPLIRLQMQDELLSLQSELKKSIVFVTHDLDEALRLGDTVSLMEQGEFVQTGHPEEIILNPKTEYVSRFVQRADTGRVLKVSSVATKLRDSDTRFTVTSEESTSKVQDSLTGNLYCLDCEQVAFECAIRGRTYQVVKEKEPRRKNTVRSISENVHLIEAMKISADQDSEFPIVVTDEEGRFEGVVTDKELLRGLLINKR